jgi:hypothetical protein
MGRASTSESPAAARAGPVARGLERDQIYIGVDFCEAPLRYLQHPGQMGLGGLKFGLRLERVGPGSAQVHLGAFGLLRGGKFDLVQVSRMRPQPERPLRVL